MEVGLLMMTQALVRPYLVDGWGGLLALRRGFLSIGSLGLAACGWVGQVRVWWIWFGWSSSQCVKAGLGDLLLISQDGNGPGQIL